MLRVAALLGLLTVAACATPDAATMSSRSDLELCQTYAMGRAGLSPAWMNAAEAELMRRKAITNDERIDAERQRVRIGMKEHVAVCAWGPYVTVNRTTGSWGTDKQYVMGQFGPYVYTRNGVVTAFQN